jgi:hypothetical protein
MGNSRSRLAALETASAARRDTGQAIANKALESLGSEGVEPLISAFSAERAGRELTEPESAARQVYSHALRREYPWARRQGGKPTAQESAAIQIHVSEIERLFHLAGLKSTEELEALGTQAAGGNR